VNHFELNILYPLSLVPYFNVSEDILSLFYLKQVLKEDTVVYGHVSGLIVLCHDLAKHLSTCPHPTEFARKRRSRGKTVRCAASLLGGGGN